MEKKFELKVNLIFWTIVVGALALATVYQAQALNRDLSRIAGSIRVKVPSIIIIGGTAQIFVTRYCRRIRKHLGEFDSSRTDARDFVITLQKYLGRLKRVFITVNSAGFFLGPSVTFVIYHFAGKGYHPLEMLFIITNHVLIGVLISLLQITMLQLTFQEILSSFNIYSNIEELKTMDVTKRRRLIMFSFLGLFLFLTGGHIYGIMTHISRGGLDPAEALYRTVFEFLFSGAVYTGFLMAVYIILTKEERNKMNQIQRSLDTNLSQKDHGFTKISIISYDNYADLAASMNAYTDRLSTLLGDITRAGQFVSRTSGDLTRSVERSNGALEKMRRVNSSMSREIDISRETLSGATGNVEGISLSVGKMSEAVQTQSGYVSESSAAITEMSANIQSVAQISQKASAETGSLKSVLQEGSERLRETVEAINNLKEASAQVGTIVKSIQSISAQTNLLAMNAAIEAAHAGEAGAGFSVVADEVRKLAEESSVSANRITEIIKGMTNGITLGVESAKRTDSFFEEITRSVENTSRIITQVTTAMDEQQTAADDISSAMNSLVDVSRNIEEESESQRAIRDDMGRAFEHLLSSMTELKAKADLLREEDSRLGEEVEGLKKVSETNEEAVEVLERAVKG